TISDMSVVETELAGDGASGPSSKLGQEPLFLIHAYPNQTFHGEVTEVGGSPILPAAGATTTATRFEVKVQIRDPPPNIKPGLSVQSDILPGFRQQALVVPIQALVIRDRERKPGDAQSGTARAEEGVFLMGACQARCE